jgi:phosphoenolpyruvate synthase/pyruvate phosphate dikinase
MDESFISWLSEVSLADANRVGEKAAHLAELHNKKLPVPNAFVIDPQFFKNIVSKYYVELEDALSQVTDLQSSYTAAKQVRAILSKFSLTSEAKDLLLANYRQINDHPDHEKMSSLTRQLVTAGRDLPFVAIRASPLEATPLLIQSVLNAYGIEQIVESIRKVIISAFSPQAIFYRHTKNKSQLDFSIAIIVQKMVHAVKSGDMFTLNPIKNSKSEIYAQVVWGINPNYLTNPSTFVFDKNTLAISESRNVQQDEYYTKNAQFGEILLEPLPVHLRQVHKLSEGERKALADLAAQVERIMNFPQYIEWVVERNTIQIVQTRPITRIFNKPLVATERGVLLNNASGSGSAVVVRGKDDLQKLQSDSIIVSSLASRDVFPYIVQSNGYITSSNSLTSPAAQYCRDFSIPGIIQVDDIDHLSDNQEVRFTGQSCEFIQPQQTLAPNSPPQAAQSYDSSVTTSSVGAELDSIRAQFDSLARALTEQVSKEAQKRAAGEHTSEDDHRKSQLMSDLEWQVRNLKKKLDGIQTSERPSQL